MMALAVSISRFFVCFLLVGRLLAFTSVSLTRNRSFNEASRTWATVEQGSGTSVDHSYQQSHQRPFHQNWWPVSTLVALEKDRANIIQVLGKRLVAIFDKFSDHWSVLDDRCSHRFAPLSEGRVEHHNGTTCLQCAYHGWEFNPQGTCMRLPQQPDRLDKARPVQAYPVRERVGMLWVWTDPASADLGETIQLPIDPLLERWVDQYGGNAGFMRDLPYGVEILGENLLDLSHLPFAHHAVGSLRREDGGPLPMRMLSEAERVENAEWEKEATGDETVVLPLYQSEILEAGIHDPAFIVASRRMGNPPEAATWTSTCAFYVPCHARYRRLQGPGLDSHVDLFWCPTSEGRSRVFLFNVFEQFLSSLDEPERAAFQRFTAALNPKMWKDRLVKALIWSKFDPSKKPMHMLSHKIFDGDGIFLHKQGNRMMEADLTYKDYSTPSSTDSVLNAYRRYLAKAAAQTRELGLDSVANAVVGSSTYTDDVPRAVLLDRYHAHTVHCPVCSEALQQTKAKQARNQALHTASLGAAGAATTALATLLAMPRLLVVTLAPGLVGIVSGVTAATWLSSMATRRAAKKLDEEVNAFYFEDFVHAEND